MCVCVVLVLVAVLYVVVSMLWRVDYIRVVMVVVSSSSHADAEEAA